MFKNLFNLQQGCNDPGRVGEDVGEEETNVNFVTHTPHLSVSHNDSSL